MSSEETNLSLYFACSVAYKHLLWLDYFRYVVAVVSLQAVQWTEECIYKFEDR